MSDLIEQLLKYPNLNAEKAVARFRELEAERDRFKRDWEHASTVRPHVIADIEAKTIELCAHWLTRAAPSFWTPDDCAAGLLRLKSDPESFHALKPSEERNGG